MDRDLLILIWQNRLFKTGDLHFSSPAHYEVLSTGLRVEGAAADFVHVVLLNLTTGEKVRGSVKIDVNASDWRAQGTVSAAELSGVVLHLVFNRDTLLLQSGETMLTCTLTPNAALVEKRMRMAVECVDYFAAMDESIREHLLERLVVDRLNRKSDEMTSIALSVDGDWDQVAYICLMRSMGYKNKKEMFDRLARSLPLSFLMHHVSSNMVVEALMLGQAGYLDIGGTVDDYTRDLQCKFEILRAQNALLPPPLDWSGAGVRAHSMPAISLVRAAAIVCHNDGLLASVLGCHTINELYSILDVPLADYWQTHYAPSVMTELNGLASISAEKINLLIINFVIPLMISYGEWVGRGEYVERALGLLEQLPAENNTYTRRWGSTMFRLRSAYVSQGLIQLSAVYCVRGLCSSCPLGAEQLVDFFVKGGA